MYIVSKMIANHLILGCCLLLLPSIFPSIRVFPVSQLFASGGQSIRASASASVLPVNNAGLTLMSVGNTPPRTEWVNVGLESRVMSDPDFVQ